MSVTITRDALKLTDVADVMRNGDFDPDWLIPAWLYRGAVHWMSGPPGEGKSLIALWFCAQLISRGETVLYLDEENDERTMAERLLLLGATAEEVEEHFLYALSPQLTEERVGNFKATLEEHRPALVVFDSSADFLAAASADENSAVDVTRWITKTVCRQLREYDGTALVVDHMPHEARRARGTGAKKAKSEVSYLIRMTEPFSRQQIGQITVEYDKDRFGWLPFRRFIRAGSDSTEGFVFEEQPDMQISIRSKKRAPQVTGAESEYFNAVAAGAATVTEVIDATGKTDRKNVAAQLKKLVEEGLLTKEKDGRTHRYYVAEIDDEGAES